jgi:hypothetical protein
MADVGTDLPSPPAKRPRGKYTSRACVPCRRRKLKCSGDDPCERCVRQDETCIFTETTRGSIAHIANINGNNYAPATLNGHGILSFEERLSRLETKFESFSSRMGESLRTSAEPEQEREGDYQGGTALNAPINAFNNSIQPIRDQLGLPSHHSPALTHLNQQGRASDAFESPSIAHDPAQCIRVGSRTLLFPSSQDYEEYARFFFDDINPCHCCVNEADFRQRSRKLAMERTVGKDDVCFLALNYIIFACADILRHSSTATSQDKLPGWQWFQVADGLVGKRKVSGRGDISLVQFLVYEAFYLVHADKPNAAYNVIGLACRLCFQFGLHQQRLWSECDEVTIHIRQRLCWTVYFTDRRIALSCGRPYGMRDSDVKLDKPSWLNDADVVLGHRLPEPDNYQSSIMYLHCMIDFARLAGEVWDRVFAAGVSDLSSEVIVILDARIRHWVETVLPAMRLLPPNSQPTQRHLRQYCLVVTRFNHLRLLLRRRAMVSLTYDATTGSLCGNLAVETVDQIALHKLDIPQQSSFRFHMAVSLGGAILVLATLLCRDLTTIGLQSQRTRYAESFHNATQMLNELSTYLNAAKRIAEDLASITQVVNSVNTQSIAQGPRYTNIPDDLDAMFPYGAIDFAQQHDTLQDPPSVTSHAGSGALNFDAFASLDSWEHDYNVTTGYGVPWI